MGALTFSLPGNVPSDYTDLAEVFSKQHAYYSATVLSLRLCH